MAARGLVDDRRWLGWQPNLSPGPLNERLLEQIDPWMSHCVSLINLHKEQDFVGTLELSEKRYFAHCFQLVEGPEAYERLEGGYPGFSFVPFGPIYIDSTRYLW